MLRTLAINSNQIVLSFGVLIAFLSPKQSEIEESSLESISKSRIQGVWDPAHSIRLLPLYIRLPPLYIRPTPFHPDGIRNYAPPPFHPDDIRNSAAAAIPSGCLTSGIQEPDGRGGRFNFSRYTYSDPLIALTRRVSQPFCTVLIVFTRRISQPFFAQCRGVLLKLPGMCDRHL